MSHDIYGSGDWFKQLYTNMSAHLPVVGRSEDYMMAEQVPSISDIFMYRSITNKSIKCIKLEWKKNK